MTISDIEPIEDFTNPDVRKYSAKVIGKPGLYEVRMVWQAREKAIWTSAPVKLMLPEEKKVIFTFDPTNMPNSNSKGYWTCTETKLK